MQNGRCSLIHDYLLHKSISLVSSSESFVCRLVASSFCRNGIRHFSVGGIACSVTFRRLITSWGDVDLGFNPVSCWILKRFAPVTDPLSLTALLATATTSGLSLFNSVDTNLTYLDITLVLTDTMHGARAFVTKYVWVLLGQSQANLIGGSTFILHLLGGTNTFLTNSKEGDECRNLRTWHIPTAPYTKFHCYLHKCVYILNTCYQTFCFWASAFKASFEKQLLRFSIPHFQFNKLNSFQTTSMNQAAQISWDERRARRVRREG